MTKLTFKAEFGPRLTPTDEVAIAWCVKNQGKDVTGEFRTVRSPEHNRMFWAVASKAFENLPERFADYWPDKYAMVKGLQLALGFTETMVKPTREGREVVHVPKSLDFANMDQDEFNTTSDMLFRGMARMLGVDVPTLLEESRW